MFTRVVLLLICIVVLAPGAVQAQTDTRWDIVATAGLVAAHTPRTEGSAGYEEPWFHTLQGGLTVGRYLTPHLKLELEATATTGGTQFRQRLATVPGYPSPYPIGSEVTTAMRSMASMMTWQFRDNEWVHPFVQAGASADFDRVTVRTWEQFVHGRREPGAMPERVVEPRVEGPATTRALRGVLGGGAKLYVTPRSFVRTDGRWSFDRERHDVVFRVGFGVDF